MNKHISYFDAMSTTVDEGKRDDPIELEPIVLTLESHPRKVFIITIRNDSTDLTKRTYFKHMYIASSLYEYAKRRIESGMPILLPDTMDPKHPICSNNMSRLLMYVDATTKFPHETFESLGMSIDGNNLCTSPQIMSIVDDFFTKPVTEEIKDKFRFFTTYLDVIRYLNGGILYNRASAEERLDNCPIGTAIIRESSYAKYNNETEEFFAITIRGATGKNNFVFCHRKGYGIFEANKYVEIDYFKGEYFVDGDYQYFPCIADFIIHYQKLGNTFYISSKDTNVYSF
jgi:hypothetical protein